MSPYAVGLEAFRAGSHDTAAALFTQAIELEPGYVKLYDARSLTFSRLGRNQDALRDVREVIRLVPDSYRGYLRGGKLWMEAERFDKAVKMLKEGLGRAAGDSKGAEILAEELDRALDFKAKAEHCPISRLPLEILVEIVRLASEDDFEPAEHLSARKIHTNALFAAQNVSRAWYAAIAGTPSLWSTLRLNGGIKLSRPVAKAFSVARKALGTAGGREGLGIRRLIITEGQRLPLLHKDGVYETLSRLGTVKNLEVFVLSVDSGAREQALPALRFLQVECAASLSTLVLHVGHPLPFFDILSSFPNLHDLRTTSPSLTGVGTDSPTRIVNLSLTNSSPATSTLRPEQFPLLRSLTLKYCGIKSAWPLLSSPSLSHLTILITDSHAHDLVTEPDPSLLLSWPLLQSLTLRPKRLSTRLLSLASSLSLPFPHLTSLNLQSAALTPSHLALFASTNAPLLTRVNFAETTLSSQVNAVRDFPLLEAVTDLDLSRTSWVTDAVVRQLRTKTPRLERLTLSGNWVLSGRPIVELVRSRMEVRVERERTAGPVLEGEREEELVEEAGTARGLGVKRLAIEGCRQVDVVAEKWLRAHLPPGGLSFAMEGYQRRAP